MVAALVVCVAGVAKIWRPQAAVTAARALGLPAHPLLVRAFAVAECGAGGLTIARPDSLAVVSALAVLYAAFAVLSLALARRRATCGCFGENEVPATTMGALLSAALALVAVAAVIWHPHDLGWIVGQAPLVASITLLGIIGAAYATVIAYTELPLAWAAWSAR